MNITNKRKWLLPLCLLLAAVFVIAPAAWFAGIWNSDDFKIPFQTGGNPPLKSMQVWMYDSAFEVQNDNLPKMGWVNVTLDDNKKSDQSGYIIPAVIVNDTGDQFNLRSLHFGKIDNLSDLNPDNRIYFCFELSKAENGCELASFSFDYANYGTDSANPDPRYSVEIYDMNRNPIDHFEVDENGKGKGLQNDTEDQMKLLEFTYCFSAHAPDSEEVGLNLSSPDLFTNLNFSETPVAITETLTNVDISEHLGEGTNLGTQDTYYLYICMSPKLESFGLHEHILEFFAQSYMLFDVTFSFEVHDDTNE